MSTNPLKLEVFRGRPATTPVTEFVTITPQMAAHWVAAGGKNRTVSRKHVSKLAADLEAGRWVFNGETIKLRADGTIADGQHRLHACIEAGVNMDSLVVSNLPDDCADTVDIGRVRSVSDVLTMRGVGNSNMMGSLATLALRYEKYPHVVWASSAPITKTEITDYVENNLEALVEALRVGTSVRQQYAPAHTTSLALLQYLGADKYAEELEVFMHFVGTGENLRLGNPMLTYRNALANRGALGGSPGQQKQVALAIKAFNAALHRRSLKLMRWGISELPMPKVGDN